jgi:simple sugar transport system ATP-binding protein
MVAQGLSIIFISHKLGEVLRVSHRVAVLRPASWWPKATAADTDAQLAQWMVGHAVALPERRPAQHVGDSVCSLRQLDSAPATARTAATG